MNQELDDQVAQVVMGCAPIGTLPPGEVPPPYSSQIAWAWIVVDKLSSRSCDFSLERAGEAWHASIPGFSATGASAAEAIARLGVAPFRDQHESGIR